MTYAEAIEFLYELRWFGAKFGLENTFKLAALAGNPQEKPCFIHVAGTNGKGSTCAMLESIYRAAGLRVGLFTSPHLVSFRERIQINRQLISEADIARLVGTLQPWLKEFSSDHHPTFFEAVTVLALTYFAEQNCDLVIWETGMGGRLDATNIVTPLASVITNIGLDHQQWLGDTLAAIAAEKAGIIKPSVPVIIGVQQPEAFDVIAATVAEQGSLLFRARVIHEYFPNTALPKLPLAGTHQESNAAVAMETVHVLQSKIPVSETAMRTGLETVQWPGRFQIIERAAGTTIVDGAHNADGAAFLAKTFWEKFPSAQCALILGILRDKPVQEICDALAPLAKKILLVPVHSERTAEPAFLAAACRNANPAAAVFTCESLGEALEKAAAERLCVITGSLYLVGEALEKLGALPPSGEAERALNEWAAPKVS